MKISISISIYQYKYIDIFKEKRKRKNLLITKYTSDSGRLGESYILQILDSPLPFLK